MSNKRTYVQVGGGHAKRRRSTETFQTPFHFAIDRYLDNISRPVPPGPLTHLTSNVIVGFRKNNFCDPIFGRPDDIFEVVSVRGMYVHIKKRNSEKINKVVKPICHTSHTLSIYKMAWDFYQILLSKQRLRLVKEEAICVNKINISRAITSSRHNSETCVYRHAKYNGKYVVLKTSTKLATSLTYVVEAVIHEYLMRRSPSYIPKLIRVAFAEKSPGGKDRLILCSEELRTHKSVNSWLHTMSRNGNPNKRIWTMLKYVCICLRNLQTHAQFTHRDCHTSNVYYDETNRQEKIKFIDFDWSSIRIHQSVVSVPQYLFDTDRKCYGRNRSVDICVFMRTLGNNLRQILKKERLVSNAVIFTPETIAHASYLKRFGSAVNKFYQCIWEPLMARYDRDSRIVLESHAREDITAVQLLKSCLDKNRNFSHAHGIQNLETGAKAKRAKGGKADGGLIFDYRMGHYEYPSMIPEAVLDFLELHKSKMY